MTGLRVVKVGNTVVAKGWDERLYLRVVIIETAPRYVQLHARPFIVTSQCKVPMEKGFEVKRAVSRV